MIPQIDDYLVTLEEGPHSPALEAIEDSDRWWASVASVPEPRAFLAACFVRLPRRDQAESEVAVSFDAKTCTWVDFDRPWDVYGSVTRKAIPAALKAGRITPKDIADHTGLDDALCAVTLQRTSESGEVRKGGRGNYRPTPDLTAW